MGTRLGELVERFGGQLVGDPNLEVQGIAPLDSADASHISFLSNSKLRALAAQSRAAALIVAPLEETPPQPGIHPTASVHESAQVDPTAHIGPQVTVEAGARIAAGAVIDA